MPSLISRGASSEVSLEMMGRSCRARPSPCPNSRPKAVFSSASPISCASGHSRATWSVDTPGLMMSMATSIHSRARLYASFCGSVAQPTAKQR